MKPALEKIPLRQIPTLILSAWLLLVSHPCSAQSRMEDVVYFKNGAVLHGQVLEQWPGISLKIQTNDGTVKAYRMQDVSKIVKFELPPENAATAAPPLPQGPDAPGLPPLSEAGAAAPSRKGHVGFGLLAGGNMANVDTGYASASPTGQGPLAGFVGGCFVDFALSDVISLQPEILYTMKGTNYPGLGSTNLNYVEFPLLFQLSFPGQGNLRWDLFTGPSLAALTSSSFSYQGLTYAVSGLSSTDAGWIVGGGVEIGRFLANFRYEHGFTSINPGVPFGETNSVFSLLVGCRIN